MLVLLIEEIRDFLHDTDGDRWSDERILYYINKAQRDLAKQTRFLKGEVSIGLRDDMDVVQLPQDLISANRVVLNGCDLGFTTYDELSDYHGCKKCWQNRRGTPTHVIYEYTNRDILKLYPLPIAGTDTLYRGSKFGFFEDLGDTKYGIITNEPNIPGEILRFGTTNEILLDELVLTVHYDKQPKLIDSVDDSLEVNNDYDMAIKHYVCGHLLRSDKDSNSRSLGNEELSLYSQEVKKLKREVAKNHVNGAIHTIPYRKVGR